MKVVDSEAAVWPDESLPSRKGQKTHLNVRLVFVEKSRLGICRLVHSDGVKGLNQLLPMSPFAQ